MVSPYRSPYQEPEKKKSVFWDKMKPPSERPEEKSLFWDKHKAGVTTAVKNKTEKDKKKADAKKEMKEIKDNRPTFSSVRDPATGGLQDIFKIKPGEIGDVEDSAFKLRDEGFLNQMREEGLREAGTPSVWRDLQQGKINRQAGDVQENLAKSQLSQLDTAAMRGGVGAGARERMGQQGVRDSLMAQQEVYGLGLDADLADEQMRKQDLLNLSNVEMGLGDRDLGANQFNIQNQLAADQFDISNNMTADRFNSSAALGDVTQQRLFDMGLYSEDMRAAAAKNMAAAAPSSSGGKK